MTRHTTRLSNRELHEAFLLALGPLVLAVGDVRCKPLEIDLAAPLPTRIRLYIFNATHPPGGRGIGEHKIQIILPDQPRGARGDFDHSDGRIPLLVGYEHELDIFILWDAGLYCDFAYSRNVQVKGETIYAAYAGKIASQERSLLGVGKEIVVAALGQRLCEALLIREKLTFERITGGARHGHVL